MNSEKSLYPRIRTDSSRIAAAVVKSRRRFHQYPETGNQEFKTTARLKKEFAKLGLRVYDGFSPTGLWAELDTGRPGPVIAVRTDIDALPITERSRVPFASRIPGRMHACGHDAHMAIMLGTARLLCRYKSGLPGRVKFICQPAEEVPPGGAQILIKAGVLTNPRVDAIVALHVDPALPVGSIGLRDGMNMASVYDFDLKITGRPGHAALPHNGVDGITVAAEVVSGLQQIISRMVDPISSAVISFGTIKGGDVRNTLATEVVLEGTARSIDPALMRRIPQLIRRTAVNIARGFGAEAEVRSIAAYPGLEADPRVNRFIADSCAALYPKGRVHEIPVVLGGEDFARYLQTTPGSMFRLGVRNGKIGADKPWHHPEFMIDEAALPVGVAVMTATVVDLLRHWKDKAR